MIYFLIDMLVMVNKTFLVQLFITALPILPITSHLDSLIKSSLYSPSINASFLKILFILLGRQI